MLPLGDGDVDHDATVKAKLGDMDTTLLDIDAE